MTNRAEGQEAAAFVDPVPEHPAALAQRARIVLMAGHGYSNTEIARQAGVSRPTVII
jgi:DNA-binding CsgD family transcriptional regulator